jgi:hypothetical protein
LILSEGLASRKAQPNRDLLIDAMASSSEESSFNAELSNVKAFMRRSTRTPHADSGIACPLFANTDVFIAISELSKNFKETIHSVLGLSHRTVSAP